MLAVDYGSIARAAEGLFISSAAAAKRIRQLEAIAGAPLLTRSGRGVTPTELGVRLYGPCREMLEQRDRVMEQFGRSAGRETFRIPGMREVLRHVEAPRPEYVVQQAESLLSAIFHASGEPIILTRARDGLICDLNDATADVSGYGPDELRGRRVADVPLWRNLGAAQTLAERATRTGRPQTGELLLVPKSGRGIPVRGRLEAIQLHGERYILHTIHEVYVPLSTSAAA